jgi:hypothetical protein
MGGGEFGEFQSRVLKTLANSKSVRTTIPQVIATLLRAAPGSTLTWTFDPGSGSATVRLASGGVSSKRR